MKCDFCGEQTRVKKVQKYRYADADLENVFLDHVEVRFCAACKIESPIIPKILKLHDAIALAIVRKNSLLGGGEMRFLRTNLRVKSSDWAAMLRTDKSVYSRWESGATKPGAQSDLLVRYLYLRLLEEKKGVAFNEKIAESLIAPTGEQTAIIIDAEAIENYSYLPLAEAERLSEAARRSSEATFDFGLNEANLFLSEIEEPLPFSSVSGGSMARAAAASSAANQELALAA